VRRYGLDHLITSVTDCKPPAHVFVDERAGCFRGDFNTRLRAIDEFAAHCESPPSLS